MRKCHYLLLLLLFFSGIAAAQKKTAIVSGRVLDENEYPLAKVTIGILGHNAGYATDDSGRFRITVSADRAFALVFSYTGYATTQRNFLLSEGEEEKITLRMERGGTPLKEVVVTDQRQRREAGLVIINPKEAINIPAPGGGIENLVKVFVGSNNELTSNYSVRGGNYDENLIYVNDFEVFRPYLVRSGQQEGLSFINPEMTRSVSFYNGGFQAKYGDKMSSVLDIQYKKPKQAGGSVYIGLLEQGLHLEGTAAKNRFTWLVGLRNKTNRNLLSSQETKGNYVPSSSDFQALLTWQFNNKLSAELLGNFSQTRFTLVPEYSQQTASVFSPFFTTNLGLDIFFNGREEDRYKTNMLGISVLQQVSKKLRLKWMSSFFRDKEQEAADITGQYLFGERDFDKSRSTFGQIVNPLGAGAYQHYNRNRLDITVWNISHKGYWDAGHNYLQWGAGVDRQYVTDKLNEWEYQDSAGYSLPYNTYPPAIFSAVKSAADFVVNRYSGYLQDNILFHDSSDFSLQAGVRFNYNDLNQEFLVSPRLGVSWKPARWKKDIIFRAAAGVYDQPPFYRELRRYDGSLNKRLASQKSLQATGGLDYSFRGLNGRPMRLTMEAYYKYMTDVVPYDIDNVRIRYSGENNAKAYAAGLETRLFGELVKDAESWVSFGVMKTMENINGDYYYNYKNAAGQVITARTTDQVPVDSVKQEVGWLRRPTDRLLTFGMFFQDYLSTNKNFKVYLNTLYGSNLPYNIPNSVKYRNGLFIDPYIRIDLGFSALLLDSDKSRRRSHSPFRDFENIWATLEIFNIIDRPNTISYLLIKDFSNTIFTIPNRLTPRLINLKLVARF